MTLVVAAGLSDLVVLAADTRATMSGGVDDDVLKIVPCNNHVAVGCAGNLELIQFVLRILTTRIQPSWGIDDFQTRVQEMIRQACQQYAELDIAVPLERRLNARFVFAGRQPGLQPQLNLSDLFTLQSVREERISALLHEQLAGLQAAVPPNLSPMALHLMQHPAQYSPVVMWQHFNAPADHAVRSTVKTGFFTVDATPNRLEQQDGRPFTMLRRGNGHGEPAEATPFVEELELGAPRTQGWDARAALIHEEVHGRFNQYVGGCVTVFTVDHRGVALVAAGDAKRLLSDGSLEPLPHADMVNGHLCRVLPDGSTSRLRAVNVSAGSPDLDCEV